MDRLVVFLASGAYVGYVPVASGTFGSLLALPLLIGLGWSGWPPSVVVALIVVASVLAMPVCGRAGRIYGVSDSSRIVIDEICGMAIAGALLPKLGLAQGVMLVKQGTTNLDAYNLRLKAHQWLLSPDPKTFGMAIEQLQHAIALDPSYGDAWGELGYIYAYSATWARDPMSPMMEASTAAARALADERRGLPHTGLCEHGHPP